MRIRLVLPPLVESQKPAFVGSVFVNADWSIENLLLSKPVMPAEEVAIVNDVPAVPEKPGTAPATLPAVRLVSAIVNVDPLVAWAVMLRTLPETTSWS